jgi:hypothetical protein
MRRFHHLPVYILVAGLLFTTQACAASYGYAGRYPDRGYAVDLERRAYSNGYQEGLEHGRSDARRGRSFDYRRHDEFRDADEGYNRRYGYREDYRVSFRRGFVAGYNEAYRWNLRDGYRQWWR